MIGKNPFELKKNLPNLALGMGPYFGAMRALEKCLVTIRSLNLLATKKTIKKHNPDNNIKQTFGSCLKTESL